MGPRIYPSQQDTNTTAKGSIIVSLTNDISIVGATISVNNNLVNIIRPPQKEGLYSDTVNVGDRVQISFNTPGSVGTKYLDVIRRDYTTDDQGGDYGIRDTFITGVTTSSPLSLTYVFTATTVSSAYNFEYRLNCYATGVPTPTPTPTATSTPTPTPTATPTPTPTNTGPTPTPSSTPTSTPTPTATPVPPTATPTPTPTPTATPTPTPTATPVPLTGYTNGFYILVNDRTDSYPGTGTTWTSLATGTTYNGTLNNGPVWSGGTPGYFTFDGTNDWVDFGAASSGSTTASFTWGGWVKTTTSATTKVLMMRGNDASGAGWSLLLLKDTDDKFYAGTVTTLPGGIPTNVNVKSSTVMSNDTWYYVVGRWTAGVKIDIFINGYLETTNATSRTNLRTSGIGWNLMRGNAGDYSNGSISEFIVYQSAITDLQILDNFNANKTKYGY
jgi:hypothetical protein